MGAQHTYRYIQVPAKPVAADKKILVKSRCVDEDNTTHGGSAKEVVVAGDGTITKTSKAYNTATTGYDLYFEFTHHIRKY